MTERNDATNDAQAPMTAEQASDNERHIRNLLALIKNELRTTKRWGSTIRRVTTNAGPAGEVLSDWMTIEVTYYKPLERRGNE